MRSVTVYGAYLVAQLINNLPAKQETPVQFLGREDLLEKGQATRASILGLLWWLRQACISLNLILHCSYLGSARRRQCHPTPVLLPGKSHGRRSLEALELVLIPCHQELMTQMLTFSSQPWERTHINDYVDMIYEGEFAKLAICQASKRVPF